MDEIKKIKHDLKNDLKALECAIKLGFDDDCKPEEMEEYTLEINKSISRFSEKWKKYKDLRFDQ